MLVTPADNSFAAPLVFAGSNGYVYEMDESTGSVPNAMAVSNSDRVLR